MINLKRYLFPVILGILCCTAYFFIIYDTDREKIINNTVKVSFFQTGAYKSLDNATKNMGDGIIIKDKDLYRVYVSILSEKDNINKYKNYYDENKVNYYIRDLKIDEKFKEELDVLETIMMNTKDDTVNHKLNGEILNKYKEYIRRYDVEGSA